MNKGSLALVSLLSWFQVPEALADPCGMVPPIDVNPNVALRRTGPQKTYVFFKDGVETIVIRPGFSGSVTEFGMLVALPSPPAMRKVPDDIFGQIASAIDPPEVVVNLQVTTVAIADPFALRAELMQEAFMQEAPLAFDAVNVVHEEAIGMYEMAVLEAGSAHALRRWMEEHRFRFPDGMERVCDDYVRQRWCFVAVKARVGYKAASNPAPGMRAIPDLALPGDASFDGNVQAMAYRFRVEKPVVGMRLSTFNAADERRQIVYVLADEPVAFQGVVDSVVVRQVPGAKLLRNIDGPLPVRLFGGSVKEVPEDLLDSFIASRDPGPHNGQARDLFASDLQAAKTGRLSLPHEEDEKALLRIGERLALRGPEVDALNAAAMEASESGERSSYLSSLIGMTLTVIDGELPLWVVRDQDLTFRRFQVPAPRNTTRHYHAVNFGPFADPGGIFLDDPDGAIGVPKTRRWFHQRWGR